MNPRSKPDSATVLSSYPDSGGLGCGYVMNRWGFAVGSVSMALGDGVADERSSPRGDDDSCVFAKAGGVEGCCGRHSSGGCRKCGGKVLKCFGICLMITVLQLAQLPNIKVATVLLSSGFAYDIFWVFISPLIFHESVMIVFASSKEILVENEEKLENVVRGQKSKSCSSTAENESGREYGAKNTDDTPVTGTSQKTRGGAESRFRKRSKYLSYPYTNSEPRLKSFPAETEESKTPSSTPKAKASSRTIQNSSVHLPVTYFQEQCINEDVEKDDINDEIQEDDINDKIQEDDLNDKIQEDDVDDEFQEDDIDLDDEFQEEDIDGEFQEDDVDEEFMEDDISNEFLDDDLDALLLEDKLE
ncbi:unnamed protein product [Vicia faba]|uniref:Uncharacterized protein n=1 Tax=Vicia faba TaxID=3906 RepID=A0AAV1A259_VICFA|nr:unnamed protein product [Vicia faba]